ncbi:MAG TPA: thiamine phosphate synthase, partial [Polyangiaceae bacterium]|nr:thiamine phosphate synthase [Polyangiaceae bacterium]
MRVTVITDLRTVPEEALVARLRALPPEARRRTALQLRDKSLETDARAGLAARLRAVTGELGVRFIVSGDVALALALDADGVHLPSAESHRVEEIRRRFGEARRAALVSVACHAIEDVLRASERCADAALLSPIFATPGKGPPLGLAAITAARVTLDRTIGGRPRAVPQLALVALGGIDAENAASA